MRLLGTIVDIQARAGPCYYNIQDVNIIIKSGADVEVIIKILKI